MQDSNKNSSDLNKSVIDIMNEHSISKRQNKDNFLSKDIVEGVKNENFQNSVFVTALGKGRIWKPNKFVLNGRKSKAVFTD